MSLPIRAHIGSLVTPKGRLADSKDWQVYATKRNKDWIVSFGVYLQCNKYESLKDWRISSLMTLWFSRSVFDISSISFRGNCNAVPCSVILTRPTTSFCGSLKNSCGSAWRLDTVSCNRVAGFTLWVSEDLHIHVFWYARILDSRLLGEDLTPWWGFFGL